MSYSEKVKDTSMTERRVWLNIVLLLCVAGVITFAYLGSLPLLDPDEPVYAETAREMLQFHDFISPRIYGEFWYDKPPMYYWLVAGAFEIFGEGEFAARFPSALLATAGAILVYLSGRKLFGERAGILAGLILATSLEYFYLSKAAVTDVTLTFFLTAALLAFLHGKYYLFYGCAAFAVVTKGPIGIIFCGAIPGLYLLVIGKWSLIKRMKLLSGTVLFLVIALPWYLLMYHYHGMAFIETFLGFHNITRFLQPEHPAGSLWYYYIPVILVGFFPWIAFMVQAVYAALKDKGTNQKQLVFLVIWAAAVFGFFTLSQTKLVSYILPMYPPLALLVGWYFDKAWSEKRFSVLKWSATILTVVALILEAGLLYAGEAVTSSGLYFPGMVMAAVFVVANILVWWLSVRQDFRSVFAVNVVAMLFFSTYLVTQLLPVIMAEFSMKPFIEDFNQHYDGQSQVYVKKSYRPGFMFYSGIPGKEISDDEVLTTLLSENADAFFIVNDKEYRQLPAALQDKIIVLATNNDKILLARKGNN
ncbi:Undecaprenyl phosphate-alpha-4-amino-4-deoxy-L-arabinose arabinosyl transferase [Sporomusa silvacetica DSM 10669]|uniref:Undecaprenyl phosphate-alpha-4-amino-4-deoxy-L-arabinose arabinosyl transferase n=2 Tax=Sporomusa silvacetica TaxID=55504 RepID=A0ABZ3IMW1_9FIRM|nr:undecaprenyl phosphate-alpha-4-amino-4-deoxy-L-arabinose arabinosyl transferase [Sporomusa silvacetica DSM 10669]